MTLNSEVLAKRICMHFTTSHMDDVLFLSVQRIIAVRSQTMGNIIIRRSGDDSEEANTWLSGTLAGF